MNKCVIMIRFSRDFDKIRLGEKKIIERPINNYWNQIFKKSYTHIEFKLGHHKGSRKMICELLSVEKTDTFYRLHIGTVEQSDILKQTITAANALILKIDCRNKYNRHFLYFRNKGANNWTLFHKMIWESEMNEKIGYDYKIMFKNGDVTNCHIGNLEKVKVTDLRKRVIQHDEFDLVEANLPDIIEDHKAEIKKVKSFFKIK